MSIIFHLLLSCQFNKIDAILILFHKVCKSSFVLITHIGVFIAITAFLAVVGVSPIIVGASGSQRGELARTIIVIGLLRVLVCLACNYILRYYCLLLDLSWILVNESRFFLLFVRVLNILLGLAVFLILGNMDEIAFTV